MGTLNGHARPIVGQAGRFADHTNVSCSGNPGHLWVCWGVPPAGPIICTGPGSTKQAGCISTPALVRGSRDLAGILYGITGVCHQAANRILFPANQIVNGARGYRASAAVYGRFGEQLGNIRARLALKGRFAALLALRQAVRLFGAMDWVNKLNACVNVAGDLAECMPAVGGLEPPPSTDSDSLYREDVLALYAEAIELGDGDMNFEEFELMVTRAMPEQEVASMRDSILKTRADYLDRDADLIADFVEREIPTQAWIELSNENAQNFQVLLAEIIGADRYKAALQLDPAEPVSLIDPEIALQVYGEMFSAET